MLFDAEHNGYNRLKEPVTIRRQILLNRLDSNVLIKDQVIGHGVHRIESNIHLGLGNYQIQHPDPMIVQCVHPDGMTLTIGPLLQNRLRMHLSGGWVSRSYGLREPAPIITYHQKEEVPTELIVLFVSQPRPETMDVDQFFGIGERLLSDLVSMLKQYPNGCIGIENG